MSSPAPSFDPGDPDVPVFGIARFVGRAGLVRNLADRCSRRQSVLLYSGPKLGKTSLLLHVRWILEQQRPSSGADSRTVPYVDLSDDRGRARFLAGELARFPVQLLDNYEHLLRDPAALDGWLSRCARNAPVSQAIIWAGSRAWRDFAWHGGLSLPLLPMPLAILLSSEARELVTPGLSPHQAAAVLLYRGTHPYFLKKLRARMTAAGPKADVSAAVGAVQADLAPFFQACLRDVREPTEGALLDYLVKQTKPVNPTQAAQALRVSTIKPAADTLCYLGLITRWNMAEGAILQAGCRLFNDWYRAHEAQTT